MVKLRRGMTRVSYTNYLHLKALWGSTLAHILAEQYNAQTNHLEGKLRNQLITEEEFSKKYFYGLQPEPKRTMSQFYKKLSPSYSGCNLNLFSTGPSIFLSLSCNLIVKSFSSSYNWIVTGLSFHHESKNQNVFSYRRSHSKTFMVAVKIRFTSLQIWIVCHKKHALCWKRQENMPKVMQLGQNVN